MVIVLNCGLEVRKVIVRIRFSSGYSYKNRLNKKELDELIDFLGEDVRAAQMKIGENGEPEAKNYRETFDPKEAEKDDNYKLVFPADMFEIESGETYLVSLGSFTNKFPNLEFTIKGRPKSIGSNELDLFEELKTIAEKVESATAKFDKHVQFNQKCDVHVPNLGLLSINKLAFATDYCTEMLQQLLLQGWRILAVCPQPNQRRPDYILGMHVSDLKDSVSVESFHGNGKGK